MMRSRWAIATLGALALALLTLNADLPWTFTHADASVPGVPPGATACPANAKPANLSFTLKDVNNKDVRLAAFKGKVIVLDFWATWCGPCKIEIPGFVDLQNRYGHDGLQVIGVSVDDTLEQLKPYVSTMKMNYPVLQGLGHEDVQEAFGPIWGIPVTVVISRDGRICAKHTGMSSKESFEKQIKSLL
jgi:cytochrome c biogenesis protein CcmG/thiol:disulfide interchange protein DsbE